LATATAVIKPASDRAPPPGYPSIPLFSIRSCRAHGSPGFYQCPLRVVQSILRHAASPMLYLHYLSIEWKGGGGRFATMTNP
jgi:hypothetical protein